MKGVNIYEEASRCLLCQDAPCTKACQHGDPARAIRAIRFDNAKLAARWIADCTSAASSVPQVPSRSPIVFRKKKGGKKWLDDSRLIMSLFYKSVAKVFLTFAIIMAKVGCKGYG